MKKKEGVFDEAIRALELTTCGRRSCLPCTGVNAAIRVLKAAESVKVLTFAAYKPEFDRGEGNTVKLVEAILSARRSHERGKK